MGAGLRDPPLPLIKLAGRARRNGQRPPALPHGSAPFRAGFVSACAGRRLIDPNRPAARCLTRHHAAAPRWEQARSPSISSSGPSFVREPLTSAPRGRRSFPKTPGGRRLCNPRNLPPGPVLPHGPSSSRLADGLHGHTSRLSQFVGGAVPLPEQSTAFSIALVSRLPSKARRPARSRPQPPQSVGDVALPLEQSMVSVTHDAAEKHRPAF